MGACNEARTDGMLGEQHFLRRRACCDPAWCSRRCAWLAARLQSIARACPSTLLPQREFLELLFSGALHALVSVSGETFTAVLMAPLVISVDGAPAYSWAPSDPEARFVCPLLPHPLPLSHPSLPSYPSAPPPSLPSPLSLLSPHPVTPATGLFCGPRIGGVQMLGAAPRRF